MLKIKDNVNLKELEKFGFKFVEQSDQYEWAKNYYQKAIEDKKGNYKYECIEIYSKDRFIHIYIDDEIYCAWTEEDTLDTIYDLIQAGFVEKS